MPVVTSLYAALAALILFVLAMRVVSVRHRARVGLGDGGDAELARRIRVHGNAVEYVPMLLLLLLLLEVGGVHMVVLHVLGILIVVSRLLHAWGLSRSRGVSFGRFTGAGLSLVLLPGMALLLLVVALQRLA